MPTSSCHPIAAHTKLHMPDWFVSSVMLDRAVDAIQRRFRLDRTHDIPYLAGYSLDGKTVYIDRHIPSSFTFRGRRIQTDRYLILHEAVEKTLIDQLGLHYQHAHQIATRAEEAAVRADKVEWRAYDHFMQQWVKFAGDEKLTRLPADLDEKPYRDEHDTDLLARMNQAQAKIPPAPRKRLRAYRTAAKTSRSKAGVPAPSATTVHAKPAPTRRTTKTTRAR